MSRIKKPALRPIAVNRKMKAIIDKMDYISQFDENVFIGGESGTGKSSRSPDAFIITRPVAISLSLKSAALL